MTEEELQTRVIQNIRTLRKKLGLSQERLADKADISRQMMNDIEGRRRWLTKGTLVKLSNALGVDVHELFIPSAQESENTKGLYDAITKKVILQVKEAVAKSLDGLQ
ncbi:MAG: helix-turn-helix transcriptional regulator [Treponema sp.]|nr:helix-turn-helix transcriptional regulator [Treponema sp.]